MDDEFLSKNKEEYLALRNEIMTRLGFHQDFSKHAVTTCVSIWVGSFAVMTYFFGHEFFDVLSFILLFPVLILVPMSFRVYENYVRIALAAAYMKKYHERNIEENNGELFSWEKTNDRVFSDLIARKSKIIKNLNSSNNELLYLSCVSILLFIVFLVLGLVREFNLLYLIFALIAVLIASIMTAIINKYSSYAHFIKVFSTLNAYFDEPKSVENMGSHD